MFNLSPQILSECACIQANRWLTALHTRRENSAVSSGHPVLFSVCMFFCVCMCVGRQRRIVHIYAVYAYIAVCAPEKGPGPWSMFFCRLLWRHPPTFPLHTSLRSGSCECVPACVRSIRGGALKSIPAVTSCEFWFCFLRIPKDDGDRERCRSTPEEPPDITACGEAEQSLLLSWKEFVWRIQNDSVCMWWHTPVLVAEGKRNPWRAANTDFTASYWTSDLSELKVLYRNSQTKSSDTNNSIKTQAKSIKMNKTRCFSSRCFH